ncbi:hypothetical protein V1289_003265 [Bradyrhizobium sp. AZCC 2289]
MHQHINLLAHAPERLHEEITSDCDDMIYAATRAILPSRPSVSQQPRASAVKAGRHLRPPQGWALTGTSTARYAGVERDCTRG